MRQDILDRGEKLGVGAVANVVAVEILELGEIEARGRAADLRQVERGDHLLGGKNLLVAMTPAEPHEIVAHGSRQVAHGAVGVDAERAMALGEFRAVRPVDERDVRHDRNTPAERVVDLALACRIGEVIVAADDMSDTHVVVVDHHGQHVGGRAVGSQQHQVVQVLVLPRHAALDLVFDDGLTGERRLEPDHRLDAGRGFARIAVAPAAVVELRAALAARGLAHLRELLGARIAMVGLAGGEQLLRHFSMARRTGELVDRLAVPIDAEPS